MRIAVPVSFVALVALAQAASSMGCGSDAQSHPTGSTSASSSGAGGGAAGGAGAGAGGGQSGGGQQDGGQCVDHDGDQHGIGCAAGPDCNDDDATIWDDCPPNGPPSITSATMSGGTITVNGTNFGAKDTAAPLIFMPFTSGTDGQSTTDAGFDLIEGNNANNATLDTSSGIGGGSIRCLDTDESFHEFAKSFPSTDQLLASMWFRIRPTDAGGTSTNLQVKLMRSATLSDANGGDKPYYYLPKYGFSAWLNGPDMVGGFQSNFWSVANGEMAEYFFEPDYPDTTYSEWTYIEVYYRLNTIGQADGVQQISMNNRLYTDGHNRQIKTQDFEHLEYLMPFPGVADDTGAWTGEVSRIYGDNTRARVFLGNASTLAACTGRFMLLPTAWSGSTITASNATNIPSGYSWVYVVNDNGDVNDNGYQAL